MNDENYEIYPRSLYDYAAGVYCGVLVEEATFKKLAKLQAEHLEKVKRLLSDEASKGRVHPSMWTLHYPSGEQTNVSFIEKNKDVSQRIKTATTASPPVHKKVVFVAESMDEAKRMADARHESLGAAEATE